MTNNVLMMNFFLQAENDSSEEALQRLGGSFRNPPVHTGHSTRDILPPDQWGRCHICGFELYRTEG